MNGKCIWNPAHEALPERLGCAACYEQRAQRAANRRAERKPKPPGIDLWAEIEVIEARLRK
jgi:hypothetical protein